MNSYLKDIFSYLSSHLLVALFAYFFSVYIMGFLYEKRILRNIKSKIKFLTNKDKEVYFGLTMIGISHLAVAAVIIQYFEYPFIWLLCSSGLVMGGILGLLPFTFIRETKKK